MRKMTLLFQGDVLSVATRYRVFPVKYRHILQKYSAYYNVLPLADKQKFQKRVLRFIHSKRFISRGFSKVTDEMKVLISAAATQLTFGLPQIYLTHFDKILIYPDTYYSTINKMYHVGEVNPRMGAIILSWKSFVDGYADPTDSFNVGIHEMAHAIHFENRIRNSEFDFLDAESLYVFGKIAASEISRLRRGEPHFFRSYAGTNEHEFFAVALEYFFEKPVEFRGSLPLLYKTLSTLLNQDPAELYKLR
ncbi:zinc-dependent peptidase [Fulvivirga ulvae]|uniref:zinc-dependent peptidase n=1 Tax=Fulvivirga ulvae TaxID=2904245 RepID=UPI001F15962A|nr:zinc-dependent peptidase [Fulvivirga ulvae]UII34267.1 zinc-dependent peptidase [Fulvivirga ulvae]